MQEMILALGAEPVLMKYEEVIQPFRLDKLRQQRITGLPMNRRAIMK